MGIEIERKFLVAAESWRDEVETSVAIVQGYLAETDSCSVRVRLADDLATLNFKGLTFGPWRHEFEYSIPVDEAREMLARFCGDRIIEKVRHHVHDGDYLWEVDEFSGANRGLVVAEVELASEDDPLSPPPWVGQEVTDDPRYYNIRLVDRPYAEWPDD